METNLDFAMVQLLQAEDRPSQATHREESKKLVVVETLPCCGLSEQCSCWDLKVRLAASGSLGTWEIWNLGIPPNQEKNHYQNQNPFYLKCRQGLE